MLSRALLSGGAAAVAGFRDSGIAHADASIASPANVVGRASAEVWTLDNSSRGWGHPMHVHFEEGQILPRNGVRVAGARRQRHGIHGLRQDKMEVLLRFRDHPWDGYGPSVGQVERTKSDHDRYLAHCRNVVHEDHPMTTTWGIKPRPGGARGLARPPG